MSQTRFDTVLRALHYTPSRRAALRTVLDGVILAAAGWSMAPGVSRAKTKAKRKKCPACAVCASPPPVPFCAGKNTCAQATNVTCQASGPDCFCWVRADSDAPFCGKSVSGAGVACGVCQGQTSCVILGGSCNDVFGFGCVLPCDTPR